MNSISKHGYPIEKAGRKRKPALSERQKGYVVANYNRMTDGEIARNIGVERRLVCDFRTKNNFERDRNWKPRTPSQKVLAGFFDVDYYFNELVTI
jgi:hypothetical protein